jgi:hypothetical protein
MNKKIYMIFLTFGFIGNVISAFAEGAREVGFLVLGVTIVIMIPLLIRKAWAALGGTIVASGIALFFINNPTALQSIGKNLLL